MSDMTMKQRMKLPTKAEIPADHLNEWGFPYKRYAFRGFVAGFARWEKIA